MSIGHNLNTILNYWVGLVRHEREHGGHGRLHDVAFAPAVKLLVPVVVGRLLMPVPVVPMLGGVPRGPEGTVMVLGLPQIHPNGFLDKPGNKLVISLTVEKSKM